MLFLVLHLMVNFTLDGQFFVRRVTGFGYHTMAAFHTKELWDAAALPFPFTASVPLLAWQKRQ